METRIEHVEKNQITKFMQEVSLCLADIFQSATISCSAQAIHEVLNNAPAYKTENYLNNKIAKRTARHAVIHALGANVKWDCSDAKDLAVELLTDVNYHDAAEFLETFDSAENEQTENREVLRDLIHVYQEVLNDIQDVDLPTKMKIERLRDVVGRARKVARM